MKGIAKNITAPVRTALIAVLVAVVLDGITTYIGIARFHGQEAGSVAWTVARTWGPLPAILGIKAWTVLYVLGVGISGTEGEPRWWRARPHQQWTVWGTLWVTALWFGYLAYQNAWGAWMVHQLIG